MAKNQSYYGAVESSPEMRLMRQQNLPFVAEVVGRAFCGDAMVEIEEINLLRIIGQVRIEMLDQEYDLPQTPEKYLSDWIRPYQGGEGWFATRLDQFNERLIILKPSGRRVVSFVEMLGVSTARLSESALSSLGGFVSESAARLSGSSDEYVGLLEKQKRDIDARIEATKERGVREPDEGERKDMALRLSSEISAMVNGFSQIPGEIRSMAQENEEFIQSSEGPLADRFSEILDRRTEYRNSAQYRTLEALHEIHVSAEDKARFQRSVEVMVEQCREFMSKEDVRRARTLFPSLTRTATKVIEEHASLSRRFEEIFRDPDFAKRHEEARALKGARDAMIALRDHGGLGRRDARLNEIGLEVPVFPFPGQVVQDIRFARPQLLAPVVYETAPLPDFDDFDASFEMTINQVDKGAFLEKESIISRIEAVRSKVSDPSLRDVVEAYPPRYGAEELASYLWVAGSETPSQYRPGGLFDAIIESGERHLAIRCPNPIFTREGVPGEGLELFLATTRFTGMNELLENLPWDGPREVTAKKHYGEDRDVVK
jgi:hypothetical protein